MVSLSSLIETIKTTPVSIKFLRDRVPDKVDVVVYQALKDKHRSSVFKGKRAVVVLIPKKGSKMGHFIVLIPKPSHIEYFSSLGGSFTEELDKLHESTEIFKNLLGKNFIYNRVKLQSGAYKIEDCAAFVLARVFLSKLKQREFVGLFQRRLSLQSPDDIVSGLVLLHFVNV